ncbi:MAG: efflux RND transporter permease subunit [Sulfuritalea sp.]|jgi:HAE1 family hydrophobic/amphiphilic exporter-1|nr:efflux RND transporter permease subunit [Sulfuritalea sp.]
MWFTRVSINNPVFATMMMAALLVLGLFSAQRLSVEQFPDVAFPVVVIQTDYPGAAPESVEEEVTRPIEEAVNTISGINVLSSRSYESQSVVIVEFDLSTDPKLAAQDVREKIAALRPSFRDEIKEPRVTRYNPDDQPIVSVAVLAAGKPLRELTTLADQLIKKRLENVRGVGQVTVVGGVKREMRVLLRPADMDALQVGADQVLAALRSENQEVPVGSVSGAGREQVVQILGRAATVEDFRRLIVARRGGRPVTLADIADVADAQAEEDSVALINGKRGLSVDIVKSQGANTIEVTDGVRQMVATLSRELPPEVKLEIVRDASLSIRNSVRDVRITLIEGAALTILIVFFFLASWRSTVITGLTLPISLIGALLFIYALGFSINVLTLMALSISVGLLIDDAIVVRENIVRHVAMGTPPRRAALEGTQEIGLAVMATTLSIVAVFLPVGFMGGIIGRFFHQFGVTVVAAVLISMFVSFTLDPMLSSIWHDPEAEGHHSRGPLGRLLHWFSLFTQRLEKRYELLLAWSLDHRKSVLGIAVGSLVGALALLPLLGSEFVPEPDLNELQVQFVTPVGSSLELTQAKTEQADAALHEFPEVQYTYATINTGFSRGKHAVNMFVQLVPRRERKISQQDLTQPIRDRLARIAGIEITQVAAYKAVSSGKNLQVSLMGPDRAVLDRLAAQVMAKVGALPGVVDLESSTKEARPQLSITFNRELASDLGIGIGQAAQTLRTLLAGQAVGNWRGPDDQFYDLTVKLPPTARESAADLAALPIATLAGARPDAQGNPRMVRLADVATVKTALGASQINRKDQTREVLVSANNQGRPAGDIGREMRSLMQQTELPPGYTWSIGGATKDMIESVNFAVVALGLAVIFIYLILASQFGSFLQPLAIMASLPLSLVGVILALVVCRSTLNIFSIIGFVMLMGLVTKNAILLVDFINHGLAAGQSRRDAVIAAGGVRLRPIMMTTLAMIFGMIPLALAFGDGAEQRAPMGQAVIGGVMTSSLLTLIVVPVIYTYLDDFTSWLRRRFAGPSGDSA